MSKQEIQHKLYIYSDMNDNCDIQIQTVLQGPS